MFVLLFVFLFNFYNFVPLHLQRSNTILSLGNKSTLISIKIKRLGCFFNYWQSIKDVALTNEGNGVYTSRSENYSLKILRLVLKHSVTL